MKNPAKSLMSLSTSIIVLLTRFESLWALTSKVEQEAVVQKIGFWYWVEIFGVPIIIGILTYIFLTKIEAVKQFILTREKKEQKFTRAHDEIIIRRFAHLFNCIREGRIIPEPPQWLTSLELEFLEDLDKKDTEYLEKLIERIDLLYWNKLKKNEPK